MKALWWVAGHVDPGVEDPEDFAEELVPEWGQRGVGAAVHSSQGNKKAKWWLWKASGGGRRAARLSGGTRHRGDKRRAFQEEPHLSASGHGTEGCSSIKGVRGSQEKHLPEGSGAR